MEDLVHERAPLADSSERSPEQRLVGVTFDVGDGRSVYIGKYLQGDGFHLTFKNVETSISVRVSESALRAIVDNGALIIDATSDIESESVAVVKIKDCSGDRDVEPESAGVSVNQDSTS